MSPTLLSLFFNDLPSEITDLDFELNIGGTQISILLYADDIALITPDDKSLQKC